VTDTDRGISGTPTPESQAYVIDLDRDLRQGQLEIFGFPRIAGEVLKQLADDFGSSYQLSRLVEHEPALVTRIIAMANSVAFRPAGRAPRELGAAIARLGHDTVRVVLFAYSLSVIRGLPEYTVVREPIARLWDRSIRMSSLAHGLAGQIPGVSKDSAILAGLLHAMGKIFLVARAAWYTAILEDEEALDHVLSAWHARVGEALLTEWDFDANIIKAVTRYEMNGHGDSPATSAPQQRLTDVLALAHALVDLPQGEDTSDPWDTVLRQSLAARRLGLAAVDAKGLRERVAKEVEQMQGVLS
jgi:HD-like signal output (HDOD) protein